ncbi:MAG TPA: DUF3034 family protein, partial [Thermoanaerobaculia bacterium]
MRTHFEGGGRAAALQGGFAALLLVFGFASVLHAGDARLLATGGLTQIEGSAGGGIVPWAVLSGYATEDQNGGTGFLTYVA